jgi:hypothetical protein
VAGDPAPPASARSPDVVSSIRIAPITIALVDDYDIVVIGHGPHPREYGDRVTVAELDTTQDVSDTCDIVLYDSFAQPESDPDEISVLVRNPPARHQRTASGGAHLERA